jgi:branched-chain amino acid transport system substrate-binding protein
MRRAFIAFVVVTVVAVGTVVAVARRSDASITIGALYPTTGAQSVGGTEEERGVRLAVEWVNAHGGWHGRRIELRTADVDRPEAVPSAMRSLETDGVTVIVGSHGSAVSAAAAQVATEDHVVLFETGAVGLLDGDVAGGRSFFRLAPMGANLGQAAITFIRDHAAPALGHTRPLRYAVASVADAYGKAVANGAVDEATHSPGQLVGRFEYPAQGADYDALAAQIAAARPDVLFVSAYLDDGIALRRALVHAHVPLLASIGTSSSYCHPAFGDALGADAVGLFASDKPDAASVNPAGITDEGRAALSWVNDAYKRNYHVEMSAPALSGFSNALAVLGHILPAADDLRPDTVATAALKVKLPEGSLPNGGGLDLAGPDSVDPGANRAAAGVIWEWIAPRDRVVVWPPAMATRPLVPLSLTQ